MSWIIEPIIGGIIGCFTNYIAILMLFRPYNEKRIFGFRVPFTPGMISKRKEKLAKAIGEVVEENLLDKNVISSIVCSDEMTEKVVHSIMNYKLEISEIQSKYFGSVCSDFVVELKIDEIVSREVYNNIKSRTIAKVLNDKLISDIASAIGTKVKEYLDGDGKEVIAGVAGDEVNQLSGMSISQIIQNYNVDVCDIEQRISEKYKEIMSEKCVEILDAIEFSRIIEKRIFEMDMKELEQLVLKVMKKELGAIVIVGLFIGFIIGLTNLIV